MGVADDDREKTSALPQEPSFDGIDCRGARAMLGVSQIELCEAAGCGRNLLNDFENGRRVPRAGNVRRIRVALEELGAVFLLVEGGTAVTVVRGSAHGRTPRGRGFAEG